MNSLYILFIGILLCFSNVNGGYQVFTSEVDFRAAISSTVFLFEDFAGFVPTPPSSLLVANGLSVNLETDLNVLCSGDVGKFVASGNIINLNLLANSIGVKAIGGYFFASDLNCDITLATDLQIVVTTETVIETFVPVGDGNKHFWGIIFDEVIVSLQFTSLLSLRIGLDDLIISTTPCGDHMITAGEQCDSSPFCKSDCTCQGTHANCDSRNFNGCEIDKSRNKNNCGSCGNVCQDSNNQFAVCVNSQCQMGVCMPHFGDCDKDDSNGCETSLRNVHHCHTCNNDCMTKPAVVSATCSNRHCEVTQCRAGFGDCDGRGFNGCEITLEGNPNHCGSCGNVCNLPNASSQCRNGLCQVKSCDNGFCNRNHVHSDGCESVC